MTTTVRSHSPFLSTFPGRYYYDPAIFEEEEERIFGEMWFFVCRADALPHPGSYQVVTVARESIIVVRDKDGQLHAFFNVCRHRGARLCNQDAGHLKGSIQCRYHAWTYGLDGRLIGAPNVMSDEQWVAPYQRYQVGRLKVGRSISYDVHANWKLIIENTLECYHCGPMHPELCALIPMYRTGQLYTDNAVDAGTALGEHVEAFSITGKASRPSLPGLLPEDKRRYYAFLFLPNVFINLLSDHVVIDTFQPQGPKLTRVTSDWLFDPAVMAQPNFDPSDAVEILDLVNKQDWEACELTQKNMASRAFVHGGNYAPDEHHIRGFVEYVLAKLGH